MAGGHGGVCVAGGMCGRGVCVAGACMAGWGHAWQGACVAGACVAGGHAWQGVCMAGGHAWQGVCVAGGVGGMVAVCVAGGHLWQGVCIAKGACMAGGHAWQILRDTVKVSGTHPTGMHSCLLVNRLLTSFYCYFKDLRLKGSSVKVPLECIVTLQNGSPPQFSSVTMDLH